MANAKNNRWYAVILLLALVSVSLAASANEKHAKKAGAEIVWDTWGVPHIFAQDEASAFRAFGWAQMHNHGDLLLRLIAQGRGRGAEFYGPDSVDTDRMVRLFGLMARAQADYQQMDPHFRKNVDAFAAGINQFAQENPEKLAAVSKSILPVSSVDILEHMDRVFLEFMQDSASKSGGGCSPRGPVDVSTRGSNGWAIGPSHSASGHAMLLENPHLPWAPSEMTFLEAQISVPGYEMYGATLVGSPVLSIGFNDTHGWTHTVNPMRTCDTYALTANGGEQYQLDGKPHAFEVKHEVIQVKQPDGSLKEQPLEIRRSELGPVIEKGGKFYALRVAGLQAGSDAGGLQEWWEMGHAKNFAEFQAALKHMQLPMFNVIYADHEGNIELLDGGLDPVRKVAPTEGVLPGDTSAQVWTEMYGYKDLPKAINPGSGWVQNSNSVGWYMTEPFLRPADYPQSILPEGEPNFREQRGIKMLTEHSKLSYEQLLADQYSNHSELADLVLDDLIADAKQSEYPLAQQAAAVLAKWDRTTNTDSRGAYLFFVWTQKMKGNYFATSFDPQHPVDTPRGFKEPKAAVTALVAAARDLQRDNIALDVLWGDRCRIRRGNVDLPGTGGPGQIGVFDVITYRKAKDGFLEPAHGDSFMAELEFSKPLKAKVLLTYGNSSNPDSPHYTDQLAVFAKQEWREPWRTRKELAQHTEEDTVLHFDGTK